MRMWFMMIALGCQFAVLASAQVTTATVYGVVSDPSGAKISNVQATLTNRETNATRRVSSTAAGEFSFTFIPPGTYSLNLSASGFRSVIEEGLELTAGQMIRQQYSLQVSNVSDAIQVTAEAALVNAVSAEQVKTFDEQQIRTLPVAQRDWTALLSLQPGALNRSGGLAINGLPPNSFNVTVDGTRATQNPEESTLGMFENFNTIKILSLEAISEVNVTKGIAAAENANMLSGAVNIISRGGTNALHGSLFHNYQSLTLNARDPLVSTKPRGVFNQFGGSLGGPVIKDKLFFFGTYEGYRRSDATTINDGVPTPEFKQTILSAQPAFKPILDIFPNPNQPYAAGETIGRYIAPASRRAEDNHYVGRGDYYLNDSNLFSARFTHGRPNSLSPHVAEINPQRFLSRTNNLTGSYTNMGPTVNLQTRFGWSSNSVDRIDGLYEAGLAGIGGGIGFSAGGERLLSEGTTWSIEEIASISRGRHSIKTGILYLNNHQARSNIEAPGFNYNSHEDLLADIPARIRVTWGVNPYMNKSWDLGLFIQDDIKISPRMVMNLGLRYDYYSVPRERDGRFFNRDAPFGQGSLRDPNSIYHADLNNFSPRIGFAWTVDSSAKTVVRSGFGIFHVQQPPGMIQELVRNAADEPFRVDFSRTEALALGLRYPVTNASVLPLIKGQNFPWTGASVDTNLRTPYSMQWLLMVQHQISTTMVLETGYIGTRGLKFAYNRNMNVIDRVTGLRPLSQFGEYRYFDGSENSTYHAWQSSFNKRFSKGLTFNLNYTWSRTMSLGNNNLYQRGAPQDLNNLRSDWGPADFDIPHRFTTDFMYELPFAQLIKWNTRAGRLLLNGWHVNGIFSAQKGGLFNIGTPSSLGSQRADYVGGEVYLANSQETRNFLNSSAFARVPTNSVSGASIRPGTLGRNALRGPSYTTFNASLGKSFSFLEHMNLYLRVDMFNAFNHTPWSSLETNITRSNFGQFTGKRDARTIQFTGRLTF